MRSTVSTECKIRVESGATPSSSREASLFSAGTAYTGLSGHYNNNNNNNDDDDNNNNNNTNNNTNNNNNNNNNKEY